MRIADALSESCVAAALKGTNKKEVIVELVSLLKKADLIDDVEKVVTVIEERERLGSTGIGDGVAIPHGKLKGIRNLVCAFGRSEKGIDFDAVDSKPVNIFFLLLAPEDSASLHLKMLSKISKILRDPSFRKRLADVSRVNDLYKAIIDEDNGH
jgi:nitrogen PTS system EIIA component